MDISDSQESGLQTTSPEEGPQTDASDTICGDDKGKQLKEIDATQTTIADKSPVWHPLMPLASPTECDAPNFNYPDVIPECNRHGRLTNAIDERRESENISNGNVTPTTRKQTTTTSSTTAPATRSPKPKKMDTLKAGGGHKMKKKILTDSVLDFNDSSDSEDRSQYQATVGPSYNFVALVPNPRAKHSKHSVSPNLAVNRRRVPLSVDTMGAGNISDEDSGSNHSDTPNLVSLSPSSSIFDMGFSVNDTLEDQTDTIPQYTARDEARDSRNWQKITLPDGKTREIDMKVIEPFKRILSHGGYLNAGGNNAIILFSSCHLPCKSRADYHYVMDNLFYYVLKTLEQLVTDDYILIYLHGGSSRSNVPPFPWLKKCYQLLDRRLRKSLKNLYMVHPTFWLKSIVFMSRPFISSKFWRKLVYVRSLEELYQLVPVIEKTAVPEKVKSYDSRHT